jgi:hypothetical protein
VQTNDEIVAAALAAGIQVRVLPQTGRHDGGAAGGQLPAGRPGRFVSCPPARSECLNRPVHPPAQTVR